MNFKDQHNTLIQAEREATNSLHAAIKAKASNIDQLRANHTKALSILRDFERNIIR
jgi:hypothetical protein